MNNTSFFLLIILVGLFSACHRKTATLDEILGRPSTSQEQAGENSPTTITEANPVETVPIKESAQPNNLPAYTTSSELIARIKKTPCFGQCPVFEASIYANGRVIYIGRKFVERTGTYEASLSKTQLENLLNKAVAANYFSLASTYPTEGRTITDLPSTITYVKIGTQEKEITNNHDAPQALRDFEKLFTGTLEELDWKPISNDGK